MRKWFWSTVISTSSGLEVQEYSRADSLTIVPPDSLLMKCDLPLLMFSVTADSQQLNVR